MLGFELYGIGYSPWTEKARWALDHHQIPYQYREYAPLFGAMALRFKLGIWNKKLTVPALVCKNESLIGSFQIAQLAEQKGLQSPLIEPHLQQVKQWDQLSEKALAAGRALLTYRISKHAPAMKDYLPPWLPNMFHSTLGHGIAKFGIAFFKTKYHLWHPDPQAWLNTLDQTLAQLESRLNKQSFVLGAFSYADISMCAILQFVKPVKANTIRVSERSYDCWETPVLAAKYPHLLEWRDFIYASHRKKDPN